MKPIFLLSLGLLVSCATTTPAIEDTEWRLVEIEGQPVSSGRSPTLRLVSADPRVQGNAGCNQFSGPYTLDGQNLRFGALISTMMGCPLIELETRYLRALAGTRSWRVGEGNLELLDQSGRPLAKLAAR